MRRPVRPPEETSILIVDGFCGLCEMITRFVLKRDRRRRFRFVTSQSQEGISLLERGNLASQAAHTFVMVKNGRFYTKSGAALRVFREMGGFWPLLAAFEVIPAALRDRLYDTIAANRYRWFGRHEACFLPNAVRQWEEERERASGRIVGDVQRCKEVESNGGKTDLRGNKH